MADDSSKEHHAFDVYLGIEVRDKNGKITHKNRRKSRSFNSNWLAIMHGCIYSGVRTTGHDILDNWYATSDSHNYQANEASSKPRIIAGTGNTVEAPDDYDLAGRAGSVVGVGGKVINTSTKTSTTISGSVGFAIAIDIKEVGITINMLWAQTSRTFLILRDVLPAPVSVAAGGAIIVTYTLETTV